MNATSSEPLPPNPWIRETSDVSEKMIGCPSDLFGNPAAGYSRAIFKAFVMMSLTPQSQSSPGVPGFDTRTVAYLEDHST